MLASPEREKTGDAMTEPCPIELVALAERLADAAKDVVRRYFRTAITVDDKADASPVTIADREAEAAVRAILGRERPGDGIHGEEHGVQRADAEWLWVIDPIDGTKSFIAGRPIFGSLIALLHRGRPILGIIDQPIIGDRWIGAIGRTTLFNGRPAHVRTCGGLASAIVGTTAPDLFMGADLVAFQRVAGAARTVIYGGDCYSYGLVAAGFMDLVVEADLKLHDFAALVPVVEGAGGRMTDWRGEPLGLGSDGRVVAAGDALTHRESLDLLNGAPGAP